jgi:hypothetical protein
VCTGVCGGLGDGLASSGPKRCGRLRICSGTKCVPLATRRFLTCRPRCGACAEARPALHAIGAAFQTQPPSGEVAEECATESQTKSGTKCTARETAFPILSFAALLAGRVNTPSGTHHGLFNIFLASDICFSHFGFRSPRGANEKNAFGFLIDGDLFRFSLCPLARPAPPPPGVSSKPVSGAGLPLEQNRAQPTAHPSAHPSAHPRPMGGAPDAAEPEEIPDYPHAGDTTQSKVYLFTTLATMDKSQFLVAVRAAYQAVLAESNPNHHGPKNAVVASLPWAPAGSHVPWRTSCAR